MIAEAMLGNGAMATHLLPAHPPFQAGAYQRSAYSANHTSMPDDRWSGMRPRLAKRQIPSLPVQPARICSHHGVNPGHPPGVEWFTPGSLYST